MPTTLVTGANGFVAAHIIDQLIANDHDVVGSVRSPNQGDDIIATHPEWSSQLSFVVVRDYAADGAWEEIFRTHDFDFVVHVAAPTPVPKNTDFERDFLRPSVQGNEQLLKSALKYGKNLQSITVTGSINAVEDFGAWGSRILHSSDWLPFTIDDAIKAKNPFISYSVAKAESEKAIWKFVQENKPTFTVQVLLICLIFGPPIHPVSSIDSINFSTDLIHGLWNGKNEEVNETPCPSYIDVRDLATAHVNSLTIPEVANRRFIVGGKYYDHQMTIDTLKGLKEFEELEGRFAKPKAWPEKRLQFADAEQWNQKLGLKLRSEEETFGDTARKILELEKKFERG